MLKEELELFSYHHVIGISFHNCFLFLKESFHNCLTVTNFYQKICLIYMVCSLHLINFFFFSSVDDWSASTFFLNNDPLHLKLYTLIPEIIEKCIWRSNIYLISFLRGVILTPRVSVITYSKSWPLIPILINGLD